MKSQDLRPGMAIRMDGKLWVITKFTHMTPGNLRAFIVVKIADVLNGTIIEKRLRSSEEVEHAILDRRDLEYLYTDGSGAVFMDLENFDQAVIPKAVLGTSMEFLKPNTPVIGLLYEDKVISIELPKVVELKIVETQPSIKGATATNQLKEAKMETGLMIRVPGFINEGEIVRVSTESGEYLSRASA